MRAARFGPHCQYFSIAREYEVFGVDRRPVEPSALYHYVAIWQKGRVFSDMLDISLEAILSAFSR